MKKRSATPGAVNADTLLRKLDDEETQDVYERAHNVGAVHKPTFLRESWLKRKTMAGPAGPAELLRLLRAGVNAPQMDVPEDQARYLARLLHDAIEKFELLVEAGTMDGVLPRLRALPILYSTTAGKGAPEWKRARQIFEDKKVGSKAVSAHRGSDYLAARNTNWGLLAATAVDLASYASMKLPEFDKLRFRAVAVGYKVATRPGAEYAWRGALYLLDDGAVLIWPDWLELCRGLPPTAKEDVRGYKAACQAMVKEFFGDPKNAAAEELLASMIGNGKSCARARLEAAACIVAAVGRIGGAKN